MNPLFGCQSISFTDAYVHSSLPKLERTRELVNSETVNYTYIAAPKFRLWSIIEL